MKYTAAGWHNRWHMHLDPGTGIQVKQVAKNAKAAFSTTSKREFMAPSQEVNEKIDIIESRNNFAYESEIIKKYLRKPLPQSSFDSRSRRIPAKKSERVPDPGSYYKDPVELDIKKIQGHNEAYSESQRRKDVIKGARDKYFRDQNKPTIPGKNEKFGYTFLKFDQAIKEEAFRNFNPDI